MRSCHEDKWRELSGGFVKVADELIAIFVSEECIVEIYLGNPGKGTHNNVFDTRLHCRGDRNGVPVATQPRIQPQDVDLFNWFGIQHGDGAFGGSGIPCRTFVEELRKRIRLQAPQTLV
jgi:hypothetical protein